MTQKDQHKVLLSPQLEFFLQCDKVTIGNYIFLRTLFKPGTALEAPRTPY